MKAVPVKILLITLALLLTAAIMGWLKLSRATTPDKEHITVNGATFGAAHYNWVKTDTFLRLVRQAYQPNVQADIIDQRVLVTLSGANAITKDFYNGNDALLQYRANDFGFQITYDKDKNVVYAEFKIKGQAVPVPNDVLIKLIDKTTK